jgi:hypothetical protein
MVLVSHSAPMKQFSLTARINYDLRKDKKKKEEQRMKDLPE